MLHPDGLSPIALQRIACMEQLLLRGGLDHERCLLFNVDGILLDMIDGSRFEVGIPTDRMRELMPAVSSHNHPFELAHSHGDVMTTVDCDFLESRVVGPDYLYRLARPAAGWPDIRDAEDALFKAWDDAWAVLHTSDPAASRWLLRRMREVARGRYTNLTNPRELAILATCYFETIVRFSAAFQAPFITELLP